MPFQGWWGDVLHDVLYAINLPHAEKVMVKPTTVSVSSSRPTQNLGAEGGNWPGI